MLKGEIGGSRVIMTILQPLSATARLIWARAMRLPTISVNQSRARWRDAKNPISAPRLAPKYAIITARENPNVAAAARLGIEAGKPKAHQRPYAKINPM